jgi:hypothetical protein
MWFIQAKAGRFVANRRGDNWLHRYQPDGFIENKRERPGRPASRALTYTISCQERLYAHNL